MIGGFVQDQDGGIAEDGASQNEPLPLSSGEGDSPLPNQGVIALGRRLDEGMGTGLDCGVTDLVRGRIGASQPYIVPNRGRQQAAFLGHEDDLPSQALEEYSRMSMPSILMCPASGS